MIDVVVPAAGSGKRMGMNTNKLFLELLEIPILYRTLKKLSQSPLVKRIVVVLKEDEKTLFEKMVEEQGSVPKLFSPVTGGKERCDSVKNGLAACAGDSPSEIIMVHDGARPFFTMQLLQNLALSAKEYGAAIPVMPVTETVRRVLNNKSTEIIDRNTLFLTQTPQAFHRKYLESCFLSPKSSPPALTDDAAYLEFFGFSVKRIPGEKWNIKITTKEDLDWAGFLLRFFPHLNILSQK